MNASHAAEESVADEATGGAFPLRVAVKGVTVDISSPAVRAGDGLMLVYYMEVHIYLHIYIYIWIMDLYGNSM